MDATKMPVLADCCRRLEVVHRDFDMKLVDFWDLRTLLAGCRVVRAPCQRRHMRPKVLNVPVRSLVYRSSRREEM